jgi:hypothetical protein
MESHFVIGQLANRSNHMSVEPRQERRHHSRPLISTMGSSRAIVPSRFPSMSVWFCSTHPSCSSNLPSRSTTHMVTHQTRDTERIVDHMDTMGLSTACKGQGVGFTQCAIVSYARRHSEPHAHNATTRTTVDMSRFQHHATGSHECRDEGAHTQR